MEDYYLVFFEPVVSFVVLCSALPRSRLAAAFISPSLKPIHQSLPAYIASHFSKPKLTIVSSLPVRLSRASLLSNFVPSASLLLHCSACLLYVQRFRLHAPKLKSSLGFGPSLAVPSRPRICVLTLASSYL